MVEREHPYRFDNDNKKASDESVYSIFNRRNKYEDQYIGICEFDLNNNLFKDSTKSSFVSGTKESFTGSSSQKIEETDSSNILDTTKSAFLSLSKIFKNKFPPKIYCALRK